MLHVKDFEAKPKASVKKPILEQGDWVIVEFVATEGLAFEADFHKSRNIRQLAAEQKLFQKSIRGPLDESVLPGDNE